MIRILPFLVMSFIAVAAVAGDAIRSFPVPVTIALGIELYQRDKLASDGFDALYAAHPEARKLPMKGWLTQYDRTTRQVFFIQQPDGERPTLAYTLTLLPDGKVKTAEGHGAPIPDFLTKRYTARQAAIAAIPKFLTGRNYNFEVLDDPEAKGGFIVYALASSNDPDEVVVGGHYRVTVAEDGKTVKQVDALSQSALVLSKHASVPKDMKLAGLLMSNLVSNTPLETHVYLSILHQTPLFVTTPDQTVWKVADGIISKTDTKK